MTFVSTALAMLAVLFGIGAPVAVLALPRRWRMHWPVLAPLGGVALVTVVTWVAVITGHRISVGWTWAVVLLALLLGTVALVRARAHALRLVFGGMVRHAAVCGLGLAAAAMLAAPLTNARLGLTTVSLGSCDAADYAAGAALLRDVEPGDLSGFNGQLETVALRKAETFYDHWLRLNHFAPAALLAWFSQLFELPLFKLVTALAVALHAAAVPPVFWIARAGVRLGSAASLAVAACWAVSAPAVYGVAQTALGQIMVVPAVAVLTWAGLRAFREGGTWRGVWRWMPLAATAFVVLVGAYTFALIFVLTPLAAALGWLGAIRRSPFRLVRAAACGLAALALVGVVFGQRIAGLADRFALFDAIDFGWYIPAFAPACWLGWFGDARLGAGSAVMGTCLVAAVVVAWIAFLVWGGRRDRAQIGVAAAWLATAAGGYAWLAVEGTRENSNELYNAYKVFALLHPLVLAAVALPLSAGRRHRGGARLASGGIAMLWVAVHVAGSAPLRDALRRPLLWVDKPLAAIGTLASRAEVDSVNMLLEPMWARLWANSMLLDKRQYYRSDTYEGRRATPLRGSWDLRDGLLRVDTGDANSIALTGGYHLLRRAGPSVVRVELGSGWHAPEGNGAGRWVWSARPEATVLFDNPHERSLTAQLTFGIESNGPRRVEVHVDGAASALWSGRIEGAPARIPAVEIGLQPGITVLRIQCVEPVFAPPGDGRELGFALHDLSAVLRANTP